MRKRLIFQVYRKHHRLYGPPTGLVRAQVPRLLDPAALRPDPAVAPPMIDSPGFSVIYANYNTTSCCGASRRQQHAGTAEVQNRGRDELPRSSRVPALGPRGHRVVRADRNRGFGSATNLGARRATGTTVLSHRRVPHRRDPVADILDYLDAPPVVGACSPSWSTSWPTAADPDRLRSERLAVIADKPIKGS